MSAIETFALEKTYHVGFWRKKRRQALKPLTLAVEESEIFGFLGPNGAGKTTTLKLLLGLAKPTGGSARILGKEIQHPDVRAQVGFLPEHPYFYDYLTARELLNYFGQLSAVPARDRKRRIETVLDRVGLGDSADVQLRKYSKGMLQRIGIAQAILHDPVLVFLDEPMSGLDPIGRREVRDLIQSLQDDGKTVFFSTHILSDAEALCDRVAVINHGELRGIGVVGDLIAPVSGKVEVIFQGSAALPGIRKLGAECHSTGETVRAELGEDAVEPAIDAIRRAGCRLVSVTPMRTTLEDYFVASLEAKAEAAR